MDMNGITMPREEPNVTAAAAKLAISGKVAANSHSGRKKMRFQSFFMLITVQLVALNVASVVSMLQLQAV
jgi:hypothetical protein